MTYFTTNHSWNKQRDTNLVKLSCMSDAWWYPTIHVPGEECDGRPLSTGNAGYLPHCIWVNRSGKRFANEAGNYNDAGKAFSTFDPVAYDHTNLPAWFIFDQNFSMLSILKDLA